MSVDHSGDELLRDDPRRPTFIVIGAMKAGTTSLWHYLSEHPEVFMSTPKEPGYFNPHRRVSHGADWYLSLFDGAGEAVARGEASTSYTKAPDVPDVPARMRAALPDVRLVYVVREPIARMRSMYRHQVDRGEETLPFAEAIQRRPEYVEWSRYGHQASRYLDHFDADRLLIVSSIDLRDRAQETMGTVFDFLEVQPMASERFSVPHHAAEGKFAFSSRWEAVRRTARSAGVSERVPTRWKQRARAAVGRNLRSAELELPADLERSLRRRLAPDLEQLRELAPADCSLWSDG
ncbi:MAG: sulfotransferase domain-containing protein [Actinomycetota bacterium]